MRFLIALSFAGENRPYVEMVANELTNNIGQERVLYDKYYEAEFARINLDTHLMKLYLNESKLIAVFLCENYAKKEWCGLEWRAIRDLIKKRSEHIMPLRFDDSNIDGLFSTDGYIDINGRTPENVASLILDRLDLSNRAINDNQKKTEKDVVEIVIDTDIGSFSPDREKRFLKALSLILKDSDVKLISKKPYNSILLTIEIEKELVELLEERANLGALNEFDVIRINANNKVIYEKPKVEVHVQYSFSETRAGKVKSLKKYAIPSPQKKLIAITTRVFGSMLNDLKQLENTGYGETECSLVKKSLEKVFNDSQKLANSPWMARIALDFGDFQFGYERWNAAATKTNMGAILSRRENIAVLRTYRQKWNREIRKVNYEQKLIESEVMEFSDDVIINLTELCNLYPYYFRNLSGSIKSYIKAYKTQANILYK
jgi:hypothetical protein